MPRTDVGAAEGPKFAGVFSQASRGEPGAGISSVGQDREWVREQRGLSAELAERLSSRSSSKSTSEETPRRDLRPWRADFGLLAADRAGLRSGPVPVGDEALAGLSLPPQPASAELGGSESSGADCALVSPPLLLPLLLPPWSGT